MKIILTAADRAEIESAIEADDVLPVMGRLFPSYSECDEAEIEHFLRALLAHAEVEPARPVKVSLPGVTYTGYTDQKTTFADPPK